MKFLNKIPFIKGKQARGVHINLLSNDEYEYFIVDLGISKSKIIIEDKQQGRKNLKDPLDFLFSNNIPVLCSIDGKGLLHKKISVNENDKLEELIGNIFPNIQVDTVLFQKVFIDDNNVFVSVVKKETVELFLPLFNNKPLYEIYLGVFNIRKTLSILTNAGDKIVLPGCEIALYDGKINTLNRSAKNPEYYQLGSENLSSDFLVSYSNALCYFIECDDLIPVFVKNNNSGEFLAKRALKKLGVSAIVFFFSLLLVNFLIFDHYNKKENTLSVLCISNDELFVKLEELKKELQFKNEFITKSGFLKSSKLSYVVDSLASTVPASVVLNKFEVNPLSGKMKKNEQPVYEYNTVILCGESASGTALNLWISELKKIPWVKDLSITEFEQKDSYSAGMFELKIIVNM